MRAVCESFQMSKDAGFKVVAHMMPDLPNVGWERDVEQFIVSQQVFLGMVCVHQGHLTTLIVSGMAHCIATYIHMFFGGKYRLLGLVAFTIVVFCLRFDFSDVSRS